MILNMPLSLIGTTDQWYWTTDDMGLYSVKSGYKIQRFHVDEDREPIWTLLWNLSIPPKCRHLMWRLLKGILPTADNLRSHMVNIPSLCSLCAMDRESTHHLILQCPIARECWHLAPFSFTDRIESIPFWFHHLTSSISKDNIALVVMICWALWTHRNKVVWENQRWIAGHVLKIAGSTLEQWREVQHLRLQTFPTLRSHLQIPTRWMKPSNEWLKLNVDAAVFSDLRSIGVGCVLRNSIGEFISAMAVPIPLNLTPKEAELMGVREALSWLKHMQMTKVLVEMDSHVVFNALNRISPASSPFAMLVKDCQNLANNMPNIIFTFAKRSANNVAHIVARATRSMSDQTVWHFQAPAFLLPSLTQDLIDI